MNSLKKSALTLGTLAVILALANPALALDSYQDRKGPFAGIGMGGGAAIQGDPGGAFMFDLQLGGGATRNLTLAMDVDFWIDVMEDHNNFIVSPGPEVNYFFGDTGVFVQAGIGVALATRFTPRIDDGVTPPEDKDTDFTVGLDAGLGVGWEFFVSSNIALGIAAQGGYMLLSGQEDIVNIAFNFSMKYY